MDHSPHGKIQSNALGSQAVAMDEAGRLEIAGADGFQMVNPRRTSAELKHLGNIYH